MYSVDLFFDLSTSLSMYRPVVSAPFVYLTD
jgi:hypothetical protein